ncbi:DUF421 domain-containing protein [Kineococcus sp. LSe6-4]|uniref:DUF421 domain-containing protein n=1 Tax=Kineococcus halophytocola TaxID=3234027 RepID=A0ABV4GW82_9ACTN
MLFDGWTGLLRVLLVGTAAYLWLIAVLRVTGKRTLAQLNAFDFIVTVALGSTLATVLLSNSVALVEGALALALLAVLQLLAAWATTRSRALRTSLTSRPTVLLRDGKPLHEALQQQRVSLDSLQAAVRSSGIGGLELVAAVVLETNGGMSVVARDQAGSRSALPAAPDGDAPGSRAPDGSPDRDGGRA